MQTVASILETTSSIVVTIESTASVCKAVTRMHRLGIGSLLVMDGDFEVIGILTERDVLVNVVAAERDPQKVTVSEVMTPELVTVSPSTSLEEAMALMTETRSRHLPVAEDGRICGLISIGDITKSIVRDRDALIDNLTFYITHG